MVTVQNYTCYKLLEQDSGLVRFYRNHSGRNHSDGTEQAVSNQQNARVMPGTNGLQVNTRNALNQCIEHINYKYLPCLPTTT